MSLSRFASDYPIPSRPLVPIQELAPDECPKRREGGSDGLKHCGHEDPVYRTVGAVPRMRFKCCWCGRLIRLPYKTTQKGYDGHGPGLSYESFEYDLPPDWELE